MDARIHLDVFRFEADFLEKAFFLSHVKRHVGEGEGGETDADLLRDLLVAVGQMDPALVGRIRL